MYLAYRVLWKSRAAQYVKSSKRRYRYSLSMERIPDDDTVQTPSTMEIRTSSIVTKTLKAWARITALFRINSDVYKHIRCYTCPSRNTRRVLYGRKTRRKKMRVKNSVLLQHTSRGIGIEISISFVINVNRRRKDTNETKRYYMRERL